MSKFSSHDHMNIKINEDGTFTRVQIFAAAKTNDDPSSGESVLSRDATVNHQKDLKVRLYLPFRRVNSSDHKRLPIIFHFHGCSWVHFSADNEALHRERQWTADSIPALIVLVMYRLAPETCLPGQYQDAEESLLWTKQQFQDPNGEPWIKNHGELSNCFLSGAGNGGNIVFFAALKAAEMDLNPLRITGLVMNQPMFGGKRKTESEIRFANDQIIPMHVLDLVWELALPKGKDRDHPFCNPMVEGPHQERIKLLPPCLVLGFGMDPLVDRQQELVQMLLEHGVKVDAHFEEAGFHRIDVIDVKTRVELSKKTRHFIHTQIRYDSYNRPHSNGSDHLFHP